MIDFRRSIFFALFAILFFSGCSNDYFEFEITKSSTSEAKRTMEMKALVKQELPANEKKAKFIEMVTINKLETVTTSNDEIKDPAKPGEFISSEKLISAKYFISQNRDNKGENSITLSYKDGKVSTENKKELNKPEKGQPDIETIGNEALKKMITLSNFSAVFIVDKQGNIIDIDADMEIERGLSQAMQMHSGASGIVFPKEKKIKKGETWIDRKIVSVVGGFQISGNPIEIEIKFKRENDIEYKGKKVAVFTSSYLFEQKGLNGLFAGIPAYVNIFAESNSTIFFDWEKKRIVKRDFFSKNRLISDINPEEEKNKSILTVDIENTTKSDSVLKE